MSILGRMQELAVGKHPKIAIGAGSESPSYIENVIKAAEMVDFADVIVVTGTVTRKTNIPLIESEDVAADLIELLVNDKVDGVVRGNCGANGVIHAIKQRFNPVRMGRIALLETLGGDEFFLAPVGIDEGCSVDEKVFLIIEGIKLAEKLGVSLKIGVISGGRKCDVRRHKNVDKILQDSEKIVDIIKSSGFQRIKNYHILVEDAISDKSNFIIAPDGISGNLIFRTISFIGGGRAYGAPLVGIDKVYVDTSRAQNSIDYVNAIMMASALTV